MASEEKAGFVYKSNTKVSKWDKRWMVIDGYTLNSYKKKGDKKPKKVFDLSAISNDMLDYPIGSGKAPPTEHHFCVRLHTRMLNLCFESEEDRATWFKRMEAIREELFPSGPSAEELARKAEEERLAAEADAKAAEAAAKVAAERQAREAAEARRKKARHEAARKADSTEITFTVDFHSAPFGVGLVPPVSGHGEPMVDTVREGTPAAESGKVFRGDKLVRVDDHVCSESNYDDLLKYLKKKAPKKVKGGMMKKGKPVVMEFRRNPIVFVNAGRGRSGSISGLTVRVREYSETKDGFECTYKQGTVGEYDEASRSHTVNYEDGSSELVNLNTAGHQLFTGDVFAESDDEGDAGAGGAGGKADE